MVARIEQVPTPLVTDTSPEESTEHAVEDPSDHVTAPAVDPPLVVKLMVAPYAPLAPPAIVRAACEAFSAVMLAFADVAAYVASPALVTAMLQVPEPAPIVTTPVFAFTEHTAGDVVANTTPPPPFPPEVPSVTVP